jgi:hypothetical protein
VVPHFETTADYMVILDMPPTERKRKFEFRMDVLEDDMDPGRKAHVPRKNVAKRHRPHGNHHAPIGDEVDGQEDAVDVDIDGDGSSSAHDDEESGMAIPSPGSLFECTPPSIGGAECSAAHDDEQLGTATPPAPLAPGFPVEVTPPPTPRESPERRADQDSNSSNCSRRSASKSVGSNASSSTSSSSSSSSSSDSGLEAPAVGAKNAKATEKAMAKRSQIQPAAKEKRSFLWGKFKLAALHPKAKGGAQNGWGATCFCGHVDAAHPMRKCKKTLVISSSFPRDEALLRIKMWCLLGLDIPTDSPIARTTHLECDIKHIDVWDEAVVEALNQR